MGPDLAAEGGAHRDVYLLGEVGRGETLRIHLGVGTGGVMSARGRGLVARGRGRSEGTPTVGGRSRFLSRSGAPLCLTQRRITLELRVGGTPARLP